MTSSADRIIDRITVEEGGSWTRSLVIDADTAGKNGIHLTMESCSKADLSVIVLPGASTDISLTVDMNGTGAEVFLSGIYLCRENERVNIATYINHNVPGCVSRQLFKGMAGGEARTDFYGRIVVVHGAQKTEAYQENHNLLLSSGARMDTKPQLEIYADDVKCSHGATIGRLNVEEQFYMRSRGIPEKEARILQMISFVAPVIAHIPDTAARERVGYEAERAIRGMEI